MSPAVGASSCTAAMAAWIWYGPSGARDSAPMTSATSSAMASRSHRPRVLLGERHQLAEDPWRQIAHQVLDGARTAHTSGAASCINGRTSTGP